MKKIISNYKKMPIEIKAAIWFLVCSFFQKAMSAISTPIFTRMMTSEEFGAYNVFISWQGIINCVISLNLYGGFYSQGLIKFNNERKKFSAALQGLLFTLCVVWLIIYLLFQDAINTITGLTNLHMICLILIIWSTSSYSLWSVEKRVQYEYKNLVVVTILSSVISTVASIILIYYMKDKVTARILGITVTFVVVYVGLFLSQVLRGRMFFSLAYWRYALKFSIPLVPHYLSQIILNCSDRIMISNIVGESAAGIYSLAYSIAQIMLLFNTALLQSIEPWIYKQIKKNTVENIKSIAYPSFIFIAFLNILLIAFAPEVVKIFAPKEYYDAVWVIPPVSMSVYFMFTYSFFALFEFYYEKTRYISIATVIGALLNIVLNYIFIRLFGYYAAGYTTLFCYALYVVFHYVFMQKLINKYHEGKKVYECTVLVPLTLIFLVIATFLMISYSNAVIRYSLITIVLLVVSLKYRLIKQYLKKILAIRNNRE